MPQARLPDINTAFTKHRNEVITALKAGRYETVLGSLYALNGLLPDTVYTEDEDPELVGKPKYRVVMSDIEYNKLAKPTVYLFCYHCDPNDQNGILYEDVKFFNLLLPKVSQLLTWKKFEKAWKCPKCKEINKLKKTRELDKIAETQLKEPFYLGVVPKPPRRQSGLMDRTKYHNKMIQWAETYLAELEAKMAQFRDDNWTKEGEQVEEGESGFGGGEELI